MIDGAGVGRPSTTTAGMEELGNELGMEELGFEELGIDVLGAEVEGFPVV